MTPGEWASSVLANTHHQPPPLHSPSLPVARSPTSALLLNPPRIPLFTSPTLFIIFFTLLRSFWSLKTQEAYMGIINSGKALTPHPPAAPPLALTLEFLVSSCSFLWLAAELCGVPQAGLGGYLLWILAILHIHCCSVALVQQRRTEMGYVQGCERRLFFSFFFFFGVCGFLFILQRLWPINETNLGWVHEGMLALSCCWLVFFSLIWMFSSWPLHWLEPGGEDGCIPQGKRTFREAETAFSFSHQVAPGLLKSASWKPWNTVPFWTKRETSVSFLTESRLGGCNL